jgi:hypothetical protein
MWRFSLPAFTAEFAGAKTKSPLDSWAVSGLEIRFIKLLNDSDRTPAPAVSGTTTRRTDRRAGAAIHDEKSYPEWMKSQRKRCKKERRRLAGARAAPDDGLVTAV